MHKTMRCIIFSLSMFVIKLLNTNVSHIDRKCGSAGRRMFVDSDQSQRQDNPSRNLLSSSSPQSRVARIFWSLTAGEVAANSATTTAIVSLPREKLGEPERVVKTHSLGQVK